MGVSRKPRRKQPAKKSSNDTPSPAEERQQKVQHMLDEARQKRSDNRELIEQVRNDPEMAQELKDALCADLRRVYSIPREVLGPSASRDRYRQHGHYSTHLVTYLFGLWAEFQRAAFKNGELAEKYPSLLERQVQRNVSKTKRAQDVAAYADECVKPWDGAYSHLDLDQESVLLQIGSDFHGASLVDPFARRVWLDVMQIEQPDGVRFNGDLVDFPSLSRHRQLPGHFALNLQQEIDGGVDLLAEARRAAPNADIKLIMGNHDIRLVTSLADDAPVYSSLRTMHYAEQFKLDELEIGLVCRSNFLNPTARHRRMDIAQNWETIADTFTIVHGFLTGKDAPRKHLARFMRYGTNGHLHDPALASGGSDATGPLMWWQSGCMAFPAGVAKEYIQGPADATGWFSGFLMARVFPKHGFATADHVHVTDVATYGGKVWHITDEERAARAAMLEV